MAASCKERPSCSSNEDFGSLILQGGKWGGMQVPMGTTDDPGWQTEKSWFLCPAGGQQLRHHFFCVMQ